MKRALEDGRVTITFDAFDLQDCIDAVTSLVAAVVMHHGAAVTAKIFSVVIGSKRKQQARINRDLLFAYRKSGLSVKKFAAFIAEENNRLSPLYRYGPSGSKSPETLDRHLRRLLKKNPKYRKSPSDNS